MRETYTEYLLESSPSEQVKLIRRIAKRKKLPCVITPRDVREQFEMERKRVK